jgi:SMODS and SLOG-associating 2TM effector domain 1
MTADSPELTAGRQQRAAHRLEATYLLVVLAAPAAQLVPTSPRGYDITSALLLLIAIGMRLLLRRLEVDAGWVRARRESEAVRNAALRREVVAGAGDVAARWASYRAGRIDDQIAYYSSRAARHRRIARRWRVIQLALTLATVAVAVVVLFRSIPGAVVGLVSALLAGSEAWLQYRRSDVLAVSFAAACAELRALRDQPPADEVALTRTVAAVESVLERELWMWTAIMSVTVLTRR